MGPSDIEKNRTRESEARGMRRIIFESVSDVIYVLGEQNRDWLRS